MEPFIIKSKKLSENCKIPTQADSKAACFDLYAAETCEIAAQNRGLIKTNLAIEIPPGHFGYVLGRSGLALKNGIMIMGGIIDENYSGDIGVIMYNSDINKSFQVNIGDRIAQIAFLECKKAVFKEIGATESFCQSTRGANGFGSTGVR